MTNLTRRELGAFGAALLLAGAAEARSSRQSTESKMNRIGIDALSVFGLPPVDFIGVAADLGCGHISTGIGPVGQNLSNSPPWTLRDAAVRREMLAALRDRDIAIGLGEGLVVGPGKDVADYAGDLDIMAELGVPLIATISRETDRGRSFDQIAKLAEMAAKHGIGTVIEFVPVFAISTISDALEAARHAGEDKVRILVDCMHVGRSGGTAKELLAVAPDRIGYIQLCDAPLVAPAGVDYLTEAVFERKVPGEGELPLADYLAALPRDIRIGLEIPLRARLEAGQSARDRLSPCVDAGRKLVAGLA